MTEFISRNCGKEGYEIIIKTDSYEYYRAAEDFARRLIDHSKPKTNADRIRSMSNQELTEFLCGHFECYSNSCPGIELCKTNEGKANGLLKWLQQPAGGTQRLVRFYTI